MVIDDKQLKELTDSIMSVKQSIEAGGVENKKDRDTIMTRVEMAEKGIADIQKQVSDVIKQGIKARGQMGTLRHGEVVSQECAAWLGSYYVAELAKRSGALKVESGSEAMKEALLEKAAGYLGVTKATLTSTDIPLPTDYAGQVVELVWKYGQARQLGTVYPLSAATVNLPKLKTSPAFGYIAQAATVTEKSPQTAWVAFTASKWGGTVRYPSELEADSIVALGQFFARYIAREMAKIEDTVFFTADGTGTYNSLTGILGQEITLGNKIISATGNTSPDKLTLANFRSLRGKVASAALFGAAYYMNATMENALVAFNTSATVTPYVRNGSDCKLDGFPIKWVDVMPVYTTSATLSANQVGFGDLSYHYLGVRLGLQIDLSRDVYFATDEWALRAIERFTTGLMADNSNAVLACAAS